MSDQTKHRNGDGARAGDYGGAFSRPGFEVRVDRAKRELHVSATRAVAGVSLAGFCGLLIGIVALSRNVTDNGPQSARAVTPPGPISIIDPSVEPPNLPPAMGTKVGPVKQAPAVKPQAQPAPQQQAATPTTQPAKQAAVADATPVKPEALKDGHVVGFTYLVYGSYRTEDEAKGEIKRLKRKGVVCTIEQSVPGFTRKGWYCLVDPKGYKSTAR